MSVKETLSSITIQGIIALIVIIGGLNFLAFIDATDVIKTTISNLMLVVIGYYFGSSRSTGKKDETIAEFINKK